MFFIRRFSFFVFNKTKILDLLESFINRPLRQLVGKTQRVFPTSCRAGELDVNPKLKLIKLTI
jgi:hypothetical protein